jgi:flagellar FliL protein
MAVKKEAAGADKGAAPKKKGKTMIILVVASLIAVLGVGGGAALYLKKPAEEASASEDDEEHGEKEGKEGKAGAELTFIPMEQAFVVNLSGDQERFAQIAVSISVGDPKVGDLIKARAPLLRDRILRIVGSKTPEELLTAEGKETLAKEILAAVKEGLPSNQRKTVKEILFTSFIVQ